MSIHRKYILPCYRLPPLGRKLFFGNVLSNKVTTNPSEAPPCYFQQQKNINPVLHFPKNSPESGKMQYICVVKQEI